ncbi:MAG: hypothetical protein EHM36_00090 [Deltaproteobacteria bacterium]|nr:MAG: hypothetical protein EHM36_00090 [Deltaproteobacteria bacterium]
MKTENPSEEVRRAADIFQKWADTMGAEFFRLHQEAEKFGLESGSILQIGNFVRIELISHGANNFLVLVRSEWVSASEALMKPCFDVNRIAEIRHLTLEALKNSKAALAQAVQSNLEKHKKLEATKIIDELGADIMQYGGGPAKLPPFEDMDPVNPAAGLQGIPGLRAPTGIQGAIVGIGGAGIAAAQRKQHPDPAAIQKARQRLAEIQARLNRHSQP